MKLLASNSDQKPNQRKYSKLIYVSVGILIILFAVIAAVFALRCEKPLPFSMLLDDAMRGTEIESISILEYSKSIPPHKHRLFTKDKETIAYIVNLLADLQIQEDSDAASNTKKAEYNISISNADGLMLGMVLSDGGTLGTFDFVTSKSAGTYFVLNEYDFDAIEHLLEQASE